MSRLITIGLSVRILYLMINIFIVAQKYTGEPKGPLVLRTVKEDFLYMYKCICFQCASSD